MVTAPMSNSLCRGIQAWIGFELQVIQDIDRPRPDETNNKESSKPLPNKPNNVASSNDNKYGLIIPINEFL